MSPAATDSLNEIATLRIELEGTDPVIWRRVEVPTSVTLKVLHDIVQIVMGWLDCHLWEFTVADRRFGLPTDEDWGTEPRGDAGKVRLRDVLRQPATRIDYIYDFGDSWEHRLTVTDIRPGDPDLSYPRYIAGERNAPPEDCGGVPGFYDMLDAAADPTARTMPRRRNGSTITTPTPSTSCRSTMPSAASPVAATRRRPG